MATASYILTSSFTLSGGTLRERIAVQSFSGLKMEVQVSPNCVGNEMGGKKRLEPRPGPTKPGQPTFICPIPRVNKRLADWWSLLNPNAQIGVYKTEDLVFTYANSNGKVHAQWQLIGAFPISYQVSDADSEKSQLATETIQLCVTQIVREK